MDFLTHTFDEYSIAWLLISSALGGIVGGGITFIFDEFLRRRLDYSLKRRSIYRKYQYPLLQTGLSIQSQLNTIIRNRGAKWISEEYFRLSVYYRLGAFLYWVYRIESDVGFLEQQNSIFTKRLYGPFSGLSSIRRYSLTPESSIPRDILRAIGEEMQSTTKTSAPPAPMGFASFVRKFSDDGQFRAWFDHLEAILQKVSKRHQDQPYIERLVVTVAQFSLLFKLLDPNQKFHTQKLENLELIQDQEVIFELKKDGIIDD